jgi:hypothetical protein
MVDPSGLNGIQGHGVDWSQLDLRSLQNVRPATSSTDQYSRTGTLAEPSLTLNNVMHSVEGACEGGLQSINVPLQSQAINNLYDAYERSINTTVDSTMLGIVGDDYQVVEENIATYAAKMFDALLVVPALISSMSDTPNRYERLIKKQLEKIKPWLENDEDQLDVKANCFIVIDAAIKLHRDGISDHKIARTIDKPNYADSGNQRIVVRIQTRNPASSIYCALKCSERVERMITAVKSNKYVAFDVCKGDQTCFRLFANDPDTFSKAKHRNMQGNTRRAGKGDDAVETEAASGGVVADTMANDEAEGGMFDGTDVVEDLEEVSTPSKKRKRPSCAAALPTEAGS